MPIEQLKIDQGFMRDILTNTNFAAICKIVIAMVEISKPSQNCCGINIRRNRQAHNRFLLGRGPRIQPAGYVLPPLCGKDSFNDGASMARTYTAAVFVKPNMPLGQGGTQNDLVTLDVRSTSPISHSRILWQSQRLAKRR